MRLQLPAVVASHWSGKAVSRRRVGRRRRADEAWLGTDRFAWTQEYSEDGRTWKAYFHSTDTRTK